MAFVLISGMTCSGKTTLETKLTEKGFQKLVTTTTRAMREGEKNGVSYHFVSAEQFDLDLTKNNIIEHNIYNGQKYGISRTELFKCAQSQQDTVVVLDLNGIRKMRTYMTANKIPHVCVFMDVSVDVAVERLVDRFQSNSLSKSELSRRVMGIIETESSWHNTALNSNIYDVFLRSVDEQSVNFLVNHALKSQKAKLAG